LIDATKLNIEDLHAIENERSKRNCEYFVQEYVKIEDRDSAEIAIHFVLWQKQIDALKAFLTFRLVQVLKARQLGLTWLALSFAVWKMVYVNGYSVIALSKTADDAEELVRRVKFILEHLPEWIIGKDQWSNNTERVIITKHKEPSSFKSFPASENAGRSFTANLLLLDEWAFQQWARKIWTSVFPAINRPTGGQVIGLSTIERGSLFEDIWNDVKSGFHKIFLPWHSDPRRDNDWYERTENAMRVTGIGSMSSEYPATVEEALSIPGGMFFEEFKGHIHIKPKIEIPEVVNRYRAFDYGLDMLACYFIYVDSQNYARVYKEIYHQGLVISKASYEILKASGAKVPETVEMWDTLSVKQKQDISDTATEKFELNYAPPDLFQKSKNTTTGKPLSETWYENGIYLTKVKNDFGAGCISMKQWLNPVTIKDEQTGEEYQTANLTIEEGSAPNLIYSLLNIQKDKNNPNVYSKEPHGLTHAVDGLRSFCTERTWTPRVPVVVSNPPINSKEFYEQKVFKPILDDFNKKHNGQSWM